MTKIRFRLGVRFRSRLKIWYWINGKVRIFFWFWISSYFADFGQVKKLLYMAAFWMAASDLSTKTPLGETGYLSIYFFYLFFLLLFFECLGIQFLVHSHVTYGTLCHTRGHSHSCLGKQRICLGVRGILSMCFHSPT